MSMLEARMMNVTQRGWRRRLPTVRVLLGLTRGPHVGTIVGSLHRASRWCGDNDVISVLIVGRALDSIACGQEGVESLDEGWMCAEKL